MKKFKLQKVVPFVLISSMLLTGCGKKMECDKPNRHAHLYTKKITNNITLTTYYDSEYETISGFKWNPETMELNKVDEKMYAKLNSKDLFVAEKNWDYLYARMAGAHDWLEFYYEYYTYETHTYTDSDGKTHTETERVRHDGWHTDPRDSDNTGDVRLFHNRFYAWRAIYKDGDFTLQRSPLVDDIRQVLEDYPYAGEKCSETVYKAFRFNTWDLPKLKVSDFTTFNHPDLSNTSISLDGAKLGK